jgi:lipoprotein-anchoring transpeptidase ErfK/SrfK
MSISRARRLIILLAFAAAALAAVPAAALADDSAQPAAPAASETPAAAAVKQDPAPSITLAVAAPKTIWTGHAIKLSGTVSPGQPEGTVVTIEWRRRGSGTWTALPPEALTPAPVTLAADSTYKVTWTPTPATSGYVQLRASAPDGAGGTLTSPVQRLTVNPANRHHVLYEYAHYIVIVVHEYHLYYYEHGVLIRRFNVALGRPGFPTPIGTFHIYGKRKPAGGAEGACAMFYRHAGGIAIHGTDRPWLISRPIPRNFSHGCARMRNKQALWLYHRVPVGTTVRNYR